MEDILKDTWENNKRTKLKDYNRTATQVSNMTRSVVTEIEPERYYCSASLLSYLQFSHPKSANNVRK